MKKAILFIFSILAISACSNEGNKHIQEFVMPSSESKYTSDLSLDLVIEDVSNPPKKPAVPAIVINTLKDAGILSAVNHTYSVGDLAIDANLHLLAEPKVQIEKLQKGLVTELPEGMTLSVFEGIGDFATLSEYRSTLQTTSSITFIQQEYMITLTSPVDSATLKSVATDYSSWLSKSL